MAALDAAIAEGEEEEAGGSADAVAAMDAAIAQGEVDSPSSAMQWESLMAEEQQKAPPRAPLPQGEVEWEELLSDDESASETPEGDLDLADIPPPDKDDIVLVDELDSGSEAEEAEEEEVLEAELIP